MLPLTLLRAANGSPILVELKGGDTYNGRVVNCDTFMNMNLQDVICTSADGEHFSKLPSCYIRGSSIKYLRLPPSLLETAAAQQEEEERNSPFRGGRGRGRGRMDPSGTGRSGGRGRHHGNNSDQGGRSGDTGDSGRGYHGGGRGGRGRGRSSGGRGRGREARGGRGGPSPDV